MTRLTVLAVVIALAASYVGAAEPQLAHMVFFTLADDTPDNQQKLIAACDEFLTGHDGTVYYSAGAMAADLDRDVNDRDFDVALHLVFDSKESHDKYQTHPRHLTFIEENKELWSNVRVFDSYVAARGTDLPELARGFVGMLSGKVVSKQGKQLVLAVDEVNKVWKTNRAENPKALIGHNIAIDGSRADQIVRFVETLKSGEAVSLDVANKEGSVFTILELTADQRERAKE